MEILPSDEGILVMIKPSSRGHTPGPWTCFVDGEYSTTLDGQYRVYHQHEDTFSRVAYVDSEEVDGAEERKANARLIAEAPSLLAIVKQLAECEDFGELHMDEIAAEARMCVARVNGGWS